MNQPQKKIRGLYTPHACRLHFDRAVRQTIARVPIDSWNDIMQLAWFRELEPIAKFVSQLRQSIDNKESTPKPSLRR